MSKISIKKMERNVRKILTAVTKGPFSLYTKGYTDQKEKGKQPDKKMGKSS